VSEPIAYADTRRPARHEQRSPPATFLSLKGRPLMAKQSKQTVVARVDNLAGADVNVVQTTAKYNSNCTVYLMHCTGCGDRGKERSTGFGDAKGLASAKSDALRHSGQCSFQAPR
jgi:hypothetical protein